MTSPHTERKLHILGKASCLPLGILAVALLPSCTSTPDFSDKGFFNQTIVPPQQSATYPPDNSMGSATMPSTVAKIPHLDDIVFEIQREIYNQLYLLAQHAHSVTDPLTNTTTELTDNKIAFGDDRLLATISLTIDVMRNQGVNPSVSYINPMPIAGAAASSPGAQQKFTAPVSAQFDEVSHRNITLTFELEYDLKIIKANVAAYKKAHPGAAPAELPSQFSGGLV